jgi:tetratricopeptide (TPR) repeat protein
MSELLLQQATEAWTSNDFEKAFRLYRDLSTSGNAAEQRLAYQNGGACLRRLGKLEEAVKFLRGGLAQHPKVGGIHHNLGNCLRDLGGDQRWQALHHYREAESVGLQSEDRVLSESILWTDLGYPIQAYGCILRWQQAKGSPRSIERVDLIQLLLELATRLFEADEADAIASWCLERLNGIGQENPVNLLARAVSYARLTRIDEAVAAYRLCITRLQNHNNQVEAEQQQTLINASWNLACSLLQAGEMQAGWELYEFGLQAPAKAPQRWQRAFPKLFSHHDIPLWRGESLKGKRLLLIGEQAVGDTMMFLRLLPALQHQGAILTLAIQERLAPIYQRSYPELEIVPIEAGDSSPDDALVAGQFDYQLPCGSLPQHCLQAWLAASERQEPLRADSTQVETFRKLYRQDLSPDVPVVGISWRGGGRSDRIRIKSLPIEDFTDLLAGIPARFVSIQYGEVAGQVQRWQQQGLDVVQSPEVDALKDMDTWMAQVAACDLVISVANTTIHGAGALNIPTLCLLSRNSDWRWIEGMPHSYWYHSVDCSAQDRRGSWQAAIEAAQEWVQRNWPEPQLKTRDYSPLKFVHTVRSPSNAD